MKTKLLSVIPTKDLKGGGEKSFFEILKFTQKNGYKNYVIVPNDSSESFRKTLRDEGIECIQGVFSAARQKADQSLDELKEVLEIAAIIRDIEPDIVLTNLYVESSQFAAALCNTPHIYFDRGYLGLLSNRGELPDLPPKFIKYANDIVCNSKNAQNILMEKYESKSSLVYSYVSTPELCLDENKKASIIMPANFFPEKNHLDVVRAIGEIVKEQPDFNTNVIFMGSKVNHLNDKYYQDIQDLIKKLKLEKIIHLRDHVENPWVYFSKNDIYINAGEGEAVGRATLEAELLGLTTLVSDIPGHWEHKTLLGNKYLFKLHDVKDLASKITYLLTPTNSRDIQVHNKTVQKKAIDWMTPENAMGKILQVIEENKNRDNPARNEVYGDLLSIVNNSINDQARMKLFESSTVKFIEESSIELELLRKPGVKFALKKLAGSIKRKVLK